MSGCHESLVGHMPLTTGTEATSGGADEKETEYEPHLPFMRAFNSIVLVSEPQVCQLLSPRWALAVIAVFGTPVHA